MNFSSLIASSRDPEKVSLTVKSGLLQVLAILTTLGVSSVGALDAGALTMLVEHIGDFVAAGMHIVSLAGMIWGIVRKAFPKNASF